MNLIDLLPKQEKEMIDNYRKDYGIGDQEVSGSFADCDVYLQSWNENKEKLYHMFGDKFIISFPIEYSQTDDEIMVDMSNSDKDWRSLPFYKKYVDWSDNLDPDTLDLGDDTYSDWGKRNFMYNLASSCSILVSGVVPGDYDIKFDDGFTIPAGTKIFRALRRLNEHFNIAPKEEYTEWAQKMSVYFNQRKIKGTFYLSIHPMDYMTMSDNNSDWSSCMSWMENGCYHRGTIEMMNSPYVVVGYLASDKVKFKVGHSQEWNNKKWRVLYIVSPEIITSIKAYPYFNESLIKTGLDKLRALAGEGYGPTQESEDRDFTFTEDDKQFYLQFETDTMYNDFGCDTTHYFSPNVEALRALKDKKWNYINYSGPSTCVWCGRRTNSSDYGDDYDEDTNGQLVCNRCDVSTRCACCGERIYGDYGQMTYDGVVCESCLEDEYVYIPIEEEYYRSDETYNIYLATKVDGEVKISPFSFAIYDEYDITRNKVFKEVYHNSYCKYVLLEEKNPNWSIEEICGEPYDTYVEFDEYFYLTSVEN